MSVISTRDAKIRVNPDWCKKCGLCQALCPKEVLGSDEIGKVVVLSPGSCIACKICERICPDFAISVEVTDDE